MSHGSRTKNKDAQIIFLKIYDYNLYHVSNLNNKLFAEMTLSMFETLITQLDEKKLISSNLSLKIVSILKRRATNDNYGSDYVRDYIIETFRSWTSPDEKEKTFILKDLKTKKEVYKSLYIIGLDCIEYGNENSLRKVSNAMGWIIIHSMQSNDSNIIKSLINYVKQIYDIAKKMEISKPTILFLLTLFTTVGTYCEKNKILLTHQNSIISTLKKEEYKLVEIASKLRSSENDTWDELFGKNTTEYTYNFLKKLK